MFDPLAITHYWKNITPPNLIEFQKQNKHFIDFSFPPNENSLLSKNLIGEYTDKINGLYYETMLNYMYEKDKHVWKRIKDIYEGEWKLFEGKIEFEDVKQGSLGDCYFLSAISALTKFPNLLIEKFRTTTYNPLGYYEVVLFIDGEWQIVFVDDYYPMDGNDFAFAKPNNNELWAILLEKAWAKVNGGYSNIIGGIVSEVLLALTGFPSEYIKNISDSISPISLYEKIERASKEGALMGCGSYSNTNNDGNMSNTYGIIYSHNYTLIEAKGLNVQDIFLLKIRNPWGNAEWEGDWSDKSEKWTEEYKKYFNYEDKEDGIFWISVDDYVKNYNDTSICHIFYGAKVRSYTIDYEEYFKHPLVFNLQVIKKGKVGISIVVRDRRFNRNIEQREDRPFSLIIFKYDNERNVSNFKGQRGWFQNIELNEELEEGYYVVWIYIPYEFIRLGDNFKYTLFFISQTEFKSKFVGIDKEFCTIRKLLIDHFKSQNEFEIASCNQFIISCPQDIHNNTNLSPFVMYNSTGANLEFNFDFSLTNGYTNLPPYKNQKTFSVVLPPDGYDVIIRARIGYVNLSLGYSVIPVFNSDLPPTVDYLNPENQMRFNFEEDSNLDEINTIKSKYYRFIEQKKAEEIPVFDSDEEKEGEKKDTNVYITIKEMKEKFPKEFELLRQNFLNKRGILVKDTDKWVVKSNEKGIYYGQIDTGTNFPKGYGIVIFLPNNKKYIGEWEKKMHGEGIILDSNNKIIFEGHFIGGKVKGLGKYYYSEKEYLEGTFDNNTVSGIGKYHFSNGNEWEGEFVNGKKHGLGIMTYSNGEQNLVEYDNDNFMGDSIFDASMNNEVAPCSSITSPVNNELRFSASYRTSIRAAKPLKSKKKKMLCMMDSGPMIKKDSMKGEIIGGDITLDKEKEKQIEELKNKESFMFWEMKEISPFIEEKDFVFESGPSYKYLYCKTNKNNEVIGAYFDGTTYFIGFFDNDKRPNGYIRQYSISRMMIGEGIMDKTFQFINGKGIKRFDNGDFYEGDLQNGKMNGEGIYYYKNGDFILGKCSDDKFVLNSKGNFYNKNENAVYNIIYSENNTIKTKEKIEHYQKIISFLDKDEIKLDICEKYLNYLYKYYKINTYTFKTTISTIVDQKTNETYYGEAHDNIKHGLGITVNKTKDNKFYIGYYEKNKKSGYGIVLKSNYSIAYVGEFKDDNYNGYGILTTPKYSYSGYFKKGVPHGYGQKSLITIPFIQCDGIFENSVEKIITKTNLKTNTIQNLQYKNGNIISQGTITNTKSSEYQRLINQKKLSLKPKYQKFLNKIYMLPSKENTIDLIPDIRFTNDGIYIGELNGFGKREGRGALINMYSNSYIIGYFKGGQLLKGILYDNKDNKVDDVNNCLTEI